MKKILITVLLTLSLITYGNESYRIRRRSAAIQVLKRELKEKYKEEFGVKKIDMLDTKRFFYVATCYPLSDPKCTFEVTEEVISWKKLTDRYAFKKMNKSLYDYYIPILNKLLPYKKSFDVTGGTYGEWKTIPTAGDLLDGNGMSYGTFVINIFENVMEKDKEDFLKGLMEVGRLLNSQNFYQYSIDLYIYDEEKFKDIEITKDFLIEECFTHDIIDLFNEVHYQSKSVEYKKHRTYYSSLGAKDFQLEKTINDLEKRIFSRKAKDRVIKK